MLAAWSPNSWIARSENRGDWYACRRGEMRDAGVITDVQTGLREPASQIPQILISHCVVQRFFGSGAPSHWERKPLRQRAKSIERPVLAFASRKRMDDHNIISLNAREIDPRYGNAIAAGLPQEEIRRMNMLTGRRKSLEKLKWKPQIADLAAEVFAIGAVPRDN